MPTSLLAWIAILFAFLLFSAYLTMRDRKKYANHQSIIDQTTSAPPIYQNSSDYALPPKQKVVTYCVVDGRLIDK